MNNFENLLKGGELRSLGQSNRVVSMIESQEMFDDLFKNLFHSDRIVVMRTGDAIEKITLKNTAYLKSHTKDILNLCKKAKNIELKWHLALLASRLTLSEKEFEKVWEMLSNWATSKQESKIVRVNSLQGLFNLLPQHKELIQDFNLTLSEIERENIPSLNARIRKIKNRVSKI